ncbi:MAG: DNA polymerase IV [Acidimicrobiia bacterium]
MVRTTATILHVDLDAFYASVEQLADPRLRGRPVVVGGLGPRGVVAAASYEARRFGVQSAMPMVRARRACPDAVFLAPRFDAYQDASTVVMAILRSVTPLVEPIALDEAFLDVAGARRLAGTGEEIALSLRARVRDETGLVASVGVATTKLLAKLASDLAKPDGLLVVTPGEELAFLHPLPVRRLWGVGPATYRRLERFGVETIGDLARIPEATLAGTLGASLGSHLHALAWNRDDRPVEPERPVKSIGHEETFARDIADREGLAREVARLSERVGVRLRKASRTARTVQLKVRFPDFRTITRASTLPSPTDLTGDISRVARDLLAPIDVSEGVRLLGVSVSHLAEATTVQPALPLDAPDQADRGALERGALERAVDAVRDRFGDDAVGPARLADGERQ